MRQLLVDDAEGVGAALDAAMQATVAAYRDPWREADAPLHPAQFTTVVGGATDSDAPTH